MAAAVESLVSSLRSESNIVKNGPDLDPSLCFQIIPPDSSFRDGGVASRDVIFDSETEVGARIFLPREAVDPMPRKMRIIFYIHGGGFVKFNAASSNYHKFCQMLAKNSPAMVISLDYRLAPQNKLPAAYEDAWLALQWLQSQALHSDDPWLKEYADFSRIVFAGDSAGANIVHHLSVRASQHDIHPLCIRAQALIQPFFGGSERVESESIVHPGQILTLPLCDFCWSMALPEGADLDHPFCNPAKSGTASGLPSLIQIGSLDVLRDRQIQFAANCSKDLVQVVEYEGQSHGFVDCKGNVSYEFVKKLLQFVEESSAIATSWS